MRQKKDDLIPIQTKPGEVYIVSPWAFFPDAVDDAIDREELRLVNPSDWDNEDTDDPEYWEEEE